MHPERWKRIEALFQSAYHVSLEKRAELVATTCAEDPELGGELQRLLDAASDDDSFLEGSPLSSLLLQTPTLTHGQKLGNFHILELIGTGGMGEVYRARDSRLKRKVAIKVLPESFAHDPDRVNRFQREA